MLVQFSDIDMAKYINTYNSFATVTVIIQTILVVEQHTVILFQCIQLSFNLLTRIVSKVSFNFCYCCWQLYNYSFNSIVFHANIYTYNCFFFYFFVFLILKFISFPDKLRCVNRMSLFPNFLKITFNILFKTTLF